MTPARVSKRRRSQTCTLALEQDLEIIPVINKIDLPAAQPEEVARDVEELLGASVQEMPRISAKNGLGITEVLEKVIAEVPSPLTDESGPLRALVFDSHYDAYKGVIAYVRVVDGTVGSREMLKLFATGARFEPIEIGVFDPGPSRHWRVEGGRSRLYRDGLEISATMPRGRHDHLGQERRRAQPLPGYRQVKPMVFAGIYPTLNEEYANLRDALEKLQLNDASLAYQPETSQALNFGFRAGFLGLFHMEIIQERLEREYDLDILATAPSVEYRILQRDGRTISIDSPALLPDENTFDEIQEPWMKIQIYVPQSYIGSVMDLVIKKRGIYETTEYLDASRVILNYEIPLSEIIIDFYDKLKSVTQGYASLDYQFHKYRAGDLVKVEVLVNDDAVDALAMICHRDDAYHRGQRLVSRLKALIPRQMFTVPVQAAIGKRVISRANVRAPAQGCLGKMLRRRCYAQEKAAGETEKKAKSA